MDYFLETSDLMVTGSVSNEMALAAVGGFFSILLLWIVVRSVIGVVMLISQWRVFEKAWLPGWGIFIPVYNIYLMFKLGWKSWKQTRWILFPPVLFIMLIILNFDIAKRFKKHRAFGLGLWFLPIIFFPILAFDKKSKWSK